MNVIDILRDDREYYGGLGKNYLSNSDISNLLGNPKEFGKSREDNKSFAEGRYFHQLLIEKDKAVNIQHVGVSSRNTKEYKAYCEDNNLPFVLLTKEKEEIENLVSVMKSNIQFYDDIYANGAKYEEPAVGEIEGVMWKGKADILREDMIIDLKTTSDIHKFKRSARSYNYDSQCYIYQTLFSRPLVFYVIDKLTGQLGIFRPTPEFIDGGRAKVQKAVEVYRRYFGPEPTDDIANYYIEEYL